MAATTLTPEQFLSIVEQSRLVDKRKLEQFIAKEREAGDLSSPDLLAEKLTEKGWLTEWQTAKLLQGRHKGFILGKYRLRGLLGKGGMSSVYLAEHTVMRRRCAIKVLPTKRVNDTSYLGRFLREAQAVATLDHPNIVRAYDIDKQVDGTTEIHFLVMEYVEGEDLQEKVLADGQMDFREATNYIRQAADGLAHAHEMGMVHRDIKPGNLLVDRSGVVKILDMGLARFHEGDDDDEHSLTVAHDEKVLGTADYLAPEQAIDSHRVDHRADIYSLGCTLYYCLTANPPFTEGTLAQRLMAHQTKKPKAVEEYRDDIPESLLVILRKMMAKKKEERYQSAADVSRDLYEWLLENTDEQWRMENLRVIGGADSGLSGSEIPVLPAGVGDETVEAAGAMADAGSQSGGDDALNSFFTSLGGDDSAAVEVEEPEEVEDIDEEEPGDDEDAGSPDAGDSTPDFSAFAEQESSAVADDDADADESPAGIADFGTETEDESDTRTSARSSRSSRKSSSSMLPKPALISLLLLLVAGGGYLAYSAFFQKPDDETAGDGGAAKDPLLADKELTVGGGGEFDTIQKAVSHLLAHADELEEADTVTIKVAPGEYEGPLVFTAALKAGEEDYVALPAGVRVIGDASDPPTVTGSGSGPLVLLDEVYHFELEHMRLKADGRPTGVRIARGGPITLSDVIVEGHEKTGIEVSAVSNFSADTGLLLKDVTVRGGGAQSAAIRIDGGDLKSVVQHVRVEGSKLIGPFASGVVASTDLSQVAISETIISGGDSEAGAGLRFAVPVTVDSVVLTNVSFHNLAKGVSFEKPPKGTQTKLTVRRSLFADVKQDWSVQGGQNANAVIGGSSQFNLTSSSASNPLVNKGGKTGVKFDFASTKPGDSSFLKPKAVANVGEASGSEKSYAGAVKP